jgi:putative oxygen-independent coproporphyrinogen III oxidase
MLTLKQLPPLSLYIHIPWCVRKCPYCDFNSHQHQSAEMEQQYVDCLIADLRQDLSAVQGRTLQSIFFGGGTPSLFSAAAIEKILLAVQGQIACEANIEITLEANPGTVEQAKFAEFRQAGVNRLSLGVQSFNQQQLQTLGRIHDAQQAEQALAHALTCFAQVNVDLMFGLPQQTVSDALTDLQQAIAYQPQHISWYQLTLEPNTYFYKHPPSLPDDEIIWQQQRQGQALLASQGYQQYEVSAYARANAQCRHNQNYWRFGDYLGIGAGAHSKITYLAQQKIIRRWKQRMPQHYMQSSKGFIAGEKVLTEKEIPFEFMLNQLRLREPVSYAHFSARTGMPLTVIQPILQAAQQAELLEISEHAFTLTPRGFNYLDDLTQMFLA